MFSRVVCVSTRARYVFHCTTKTINPDANVEDEKNMASREKSGKKEIRSEKVSGDKN